MKATVRAESTSIDIIWFDAHIKCMCIFIFCAFYVIWLDFVSKNRALSCVRCALLRLSCNERKFICRKCIELAGRTCGEFNGWMVGSFCLKLPLIHCHRMKKK